MLCEVVDKTADEFFVFSSAERAVRERSDGRLWRLAALPSHTPHHVTGKLHDSTQTSSEADNI